MRRRLGAPVQLPTRWQRRRLPRRSSELRRQLIRLRHASTHHTVMESLEHELVPPHLSHGTQAHRRPDRELQPLVGALRLEPLRALDARGELRDRQQQRGDGGDAGERGRADGGDERRGHKERIPATNDEENPSNTEATRG